MWIPSVLSGVTGVATCLDQGFVIVSTGSRASATTF